MRIKKRNDAKALHPESLLNIPLVAQMFDDPGFKIIRRGVDARWQYAEVVSRRMDGFNPLSGAVLIARHSHIEQWLAHRHESARKHNAQDSLIGEVMFAVHDYLHAWAYRWINQICPEIGFGTAPITRRNFELMVFCHLLTEAVATVGLDYWYLSCVNINQVVPIGTATDGLTVSYRQDFADEYARFSPSLNVQSPEFFATITKFYCDGVFHGFSVNDLKLSPVLHRWLKHELQYGKKQREYSREWLAFLSQGRVTIESARLGDPIKLGKRVQTKLMREIGELLWAKVKGEQLVPADFMFDPGQVWQTAIDGDFEYQFINLNRTRRPTKARERSMSDDSFASLLRQYIAGFVFDQFPGEAHEVFTIMKHQRSLSLGHTLLNNFPRHGKSYNEPRDVFLYN